MDYTKGKWGIARATETDTNTLVLGGGGGIVADTYCYWRKKEVCEANAHLIASAPDMYEAIKLWHKHNQGTRGHFCSECWVKLEDALAKAEGKCGQSGSLEIDSL